MGLFDRLRRRGRRQGAGGRTANSRDLEYLEEWARQRRGVEAYLEPPTLVIETTLVLVAHDGEWTRRRVANREAAYRFTRRIKMPCYEIAKVGYPRRMREYQARQRVLRRRQRRGSLED